MTRYEKDDCYVPDYADKDICETDDFEYVFLPNQKECTYFHCQKTYVYPSGRVITVLGGEILEIGL